MVLDDDLDEDRFDDEDEDDDLGGVLLLELVPPLFRFILFLLRFCCLLIWFQCQLERNYFIGLACGSSVDLT